MASNRFGETKGPFFVWLFVAFYFAVTILFGRSSGGTLPQNVTLYLVLILIESVAIGWGPIIVFLIIFLVLWEKRRSLRDIFSSVGLRRKGSVKCVFWSMALFPLYLLIGLVMVALSSLLGPVPIPVQTSGSSGAQTPFWIPYYLIVYSFFPVAVVEEIVARGYILDRLLPEHPLGLGKAFPAILIGSLLPTLYHLPSYLWVYPFSVPWLVALLAGNVFPWSVALSVVYVRARTRNVIGPILIHFLADSLPYFFMLAGMS